MGEKTGTVTRWYKDKGYGFIKDEEGNSYFAHASNIEEGRNMGYFLKKDDEVTFDVMSGNKKGPTAENLRIRNK